MSMDFREYRLPRPVYEDVAIEYEQIRRAFDAATTDDEAIAAVESWDALRRRLSTWSSLVTRPPRCEAPADSTAHAASSP